ncbi:hypothetical protein JMJ35_002417 [Cladonia borealis]|uniref:WSC domain-containing protein n=1 Tax=Cladonia borealis TaxID=184061 RepID=A0AA39V3T9_9LECA|nr:hypothetical protein JMJ35_002417 [Cladonia borealis]
MTATSNPILTATLSPTASSAKPPTFASIVPSIGTYNYIGCYQETSNDPAAGGTRALSNGTMNQSTTMSVESCISLCGSSKYAGLEYGDECWCAQTLNPKSMKQSDSNCTFTCSGNQSEICGGSLLLTTYERNASAGISSNSANRVGGSGVRLCYWAVFVSGALFFMT